MDPSDGESSTPGILLSQKETEVHESKKIEAPPATDFSLDLSDKPKQISEQSNDDSLILPPVSLLSNFTLDLSDADDRSEQASGSLQYS